MKKVLSIKQSPLMRGIAVRTGRADADGRNSSARASAEDVSRCKLGLPERNRVRAFGRLHGFGFEHHAR
jgi:hypothetical protein